MFIVPPVEIILQPLEWNKPGRGIFSILAKRNIHILPRRQGILAFTLAFVLFQEQCNLQIRKFFCTTTKNSENNNAELNPWFIAGFTDGEGCFSFTLVENKTLKTGWEVRIAFEIAINEKDKALLENIKQHLGVGKIYKKGSNQVRLLVTTLKEIKILVEFFDKFPLITQKYADFLILKEVFNLMVNKEHLTLKGLNKIVAMRDKSNLGLPEKLKTAFPNVVPVDRPLVKIKKIADPHWLGGFVSAEGCFIISVTKSKTKIGWAIWLVFQVTQHKRDEQLLRSFIKYFGCGNVYLRAGDACDYKVSKFSDIVNIVIPLFQKYRIEGTKGKDFKDLCKVAELIKQKKHLTKEGLEQIRIIKAGMNRGRE